MLEKLNFLLEKAQRTPVLPQEREMQRRSFVYGNTAIENSLITREMIDQAAESLKREIKDDERA